MTNKAWWVDDNDTREGVIIKNKKKMVYIIAGLALFAVFVTSAVLATPGRTETIGSGGQIISPPTTTQLGQGCGGIMTWPSAPADEIGYLDEGPFSFRVMPPTSGNFSKPWTGQTFVSVEDKIVPSPQEALALQYRGWTVIWYRADASKEAIDSLKATHVQLSPDAKVLIAPWPMDPESTWRKGRVIILAGWDKTQPCLTVNLKVLEEFQNSLKPAPGTDLPMDATGPEAKVSTHERGNEEKAEESKE